MGLRFGECEEVSSVSSEQMATVNFLIGPYTGNDPFYHLATTTVLYSGNLVYYLESLFSE